MPRHSHQLEQTRPPRRRVRVVRYRSVECFLADYDAELSRGRLFVNCRRPLQVGDEVRLVLSLEEVPVRCRLKGRVRRVSPVGNELNETPGMQVDLDAPEERQLALLAAWCRRRNHAAHQTLHL